MTAVSIAFPPIQAIELVVYQATPGSRTLFRPQISCIAGKGAVPERALSRSPNTTLSVPGSSTSYLDAFVRSSQSSEILQGSRGGFLGR